MCAERHLKCKRITCERFGTIIESSEKNPLGIWIWMPRTLQPSCFIPFALLFMEDVLTEKFSHFSLQFLYLNETILFMFILEQFIFFAEVYFTPPKEFRMKNVVQFVIFLRKFLPHCRLRGCNFKFFKKIWHKLLIRYRHVWKSMCSTFKLFCKWPYLSWPTFRRKIFKEFFEPE